MHQDIKLSAFFEYLKLFLVFLLFAFLALALYYKGIIALPKADHAFVLAERDFYKSDWEFFKSMVSFSRTRHVAPGDAFLFRPGTHALLGLIDIFLRPNLSAIGFLSIIWHAMTAWTIFLTGKLLKRPWVGFLLGIWFLVQFSGIDMILWRHISPYMFSLIFLSLGLALLNSAENPPTWTILLGCSILFFLSMSFHEFLSIALPFTALSLLALSHFSPKEFKFASIKSILLICLLPSLVFFCLNFLDFYFNNVAIFGTDDLGNSEKQRTIFNAIYFIGLCFTAYFTPYLIDFENLRQKTSWDFFSSLPKQFFLVFGVISLFILGYAYYLQLRRKSITAIDFSLILIFNYIAILVASLVFLRMNLRGIIYMKFATYYFYFTNYLFALIFIYKIDSIIHYLRSKLGGVYFIRFNRIFVIGFVSTLALSINSILFTLEKFTTPSDQLMSSLVYFISSNTGRSSKFCYAGAQTDVSKFVDERLLFRHTCSYADDKIPLYLESDRDGTFELTQNNGIHIKYNP